jgi:hypothetical protein
VTVIQKDLLQAMCYTSGCIKRRADALANLPNLGKVDSRKGMRPLRQRKVATQPSSDQTDGGIFYVERTEG